MGSASSGRRGGKPLIEDCQTIDLAAFTKAGAIREGWCISGKIEWPSQGVIVGDLAYRLDLRDPDAASLSLTYCLTANGQTMRQVIRLASTAQPLGGKRWWLLCPVTGQRARTLHLAPGQSRFASRGALGLHTRGLQSVNALRLRREASHERIPTHWYEHSVHRVVYARRR